jgi:hypothetical protein
MIIEIIKGEDNPVAEFFSSPTNTTETDECFEERTFVDEFLAESKMHAERLERERNEARELAHRFRSLYYTQLGINKSGSWFPWEDAK